MLKTSTTFKADVHYVDQNSTVKSPVSVAQTDRQTANFNEFKTSPTFGERKGKKKISSDKGQKKLDETADVYGIDFDT